MDGFHAANILKAEDPKAFEILRSVRLPWHASGNKGITISPDKLYPVLEVDEVTGQLHRVRWNNDDRGVVPFGGKYSPDEWYDAARKWNEILTRKSIEYWFQLKPGHVLSKCIECIALLFLWRTANMHPIVFDNWRVLHGRSAFTGVRRICGGYSRFIPLNYPPSR